MAEKHEQMVSRYRKRLLRKKYRIERRSPFVDYRPDIYATRGRHRLIVEVEIEKTLHGDHTLHQLQKMYRYLISNRRTEGVLLVPRPVKGEASFLVDSVFGDNKIKVDAL